MTKIVSSVRILMVSFTLFLIIEATTIKKPAGKGKQCAATCTHNATDCKKKGGKVTGKCENLNACCDFSAKPTGSCGDVRNLEQAYFNSPSYPHYHKNELMCSFYMQLFKDTIWIKLEFIDVFMDGHGFAGGSGCDSDMLYIKGFKTWTPPPMCGNLTGYSTIIERAMGSTRIEKLSLLGLMSSDKYRWRIRVTQIRAPNKKTKNKPTRKVIVKPHPRVNSALSPLQNQDENRAQGRSSIADFGEEINPSNDVSGMETPMIVNGEDTPISEVPWQVSIRHKYVELEMTEEERETLTNSTSTMDSAPTSDASMNSTMEPDSVPETRNCSSDEGTHFCGGSIISDRHILTAAHCFYGTSKMRGLEQLEGVKIVLGDTDSCTVDMPEQGKAPSGNLTQQEHEIEKVVIHYAYDSVALLNDVLVIKLKTRINFNSNVKMIKMAQVGERFDGMEAVSSGWGMQNLTDKSAQPPFILQSSRRFLVRNASECNNETEVFFGAPMANVTRHPKYSNAFVSILCTGTIMPNASESESTSASNSSIEGMKHGDMGQFKSRVHSGPGDSGGPLVAQSKNGENVLIGIVSYGLPSFTVEGEKDDGNCTDFFQSVAYYRNWIEMAMTV